MSDYQRCRLAVLLAGLLFTVGCSSTSLPSTSEADPSQEPIAEAQGADTTVAREAAANVELDSVHFDTDDANLRGNARTTLKAHANAILENPSWGMITIEGHCDERGTDAYNRSLGERRAKAVKRYLVELGVPPDRLTTYSYGSSRPTTLGHDETAWRNNRRSEFGKELIASSLPAHRS